jgi:hypothetical protein
MLQTSRILAVVSIALLFLATIGRWPNGFYTYLRIWVCGSSVYLAFRAHQTRNVLWAWVMGAMAVLFNPLIPIYLRRSQWFWFDVIGSLVFILSLRFISSERNETKRDGDSGIEP